MRKPASLFFISVVFALSMLGFIYTQEQAYGAEVSFDNGWTLGIGGGKVINQLDKNYLFGMPAQGFTDISIDGKDGWFLKAILDNKINNYLVLGLESGYIEYDLDFTVNPFATSGTSGDMGAMNVIPLLAIIKAQYPIERYTSFSRRRFRFVPYAIFGAGGVFVSFNRADYATTNGYFFDTVSPEFALKYGAGFNLFISENVAVNIEGVYLDMDIKTELTSNAVTNSEGVENSSWLIGGALRYSF